MNSEVSEEERNNILDQVEFNNVHIHIPEF